MSNFLWVKTEKRQSLLDALDSIPEIGKKSKSEILEWALEDFVKKHAVSNNPQTTMGQFDKESILAIPNIYRDALDWNKFYGTMKRKEDYDEVGSQLEMILAIHNKKLTEFD